jgi:acyl dehydratase
MATTRPLHSAPATLPLYLRALRRRSGTASDRLPEGEWRRIGVRTDLDHLGAYCRLTGHRLANSLPGLYPHLAAFALQLAVLTDKRFPFPPLGLVHVDNRVTQVRPIGVDEAYDIAVRVHNQRPHRSGTLVDLATTATVDDVEVWRETTTVLSRGARHPDVLDTSPLAGLTAPHGSIRWRVPRDIGRRFATVSGDRNPIHLCAMTARPFGFPRAIAHGMWTAARALAAVESSLTDSYRYEVAFRRPVLLPSIVHFGTAGTAGTADSTGTVGTTGAAGHGTGRLLGVTSTDGATAHLVARVSTTG